MVETKGHSLEFIEQRYMDDKAKATGSRWTLDGFKLHTVATVKALSVTITPTSEESDGMRSA